MISISDDDDKNHDVIIIPTNTLPMVEPINVYVLPEYRKKIMMSDLDDEY